MLDRKSDAGERNESGEAVGEVFVVLRKTTVAAEPGKGSLDDLIDAAARRSLSCRPPRLTISKRKLRNRATSSLTW